MIRKFLLSLALAFAGANIALADTAAIVLDPASGVLNNNGTWSLGFEFTLNNSVTVTSLGFFADGGVFSVPHEVGIFSVAGNLLVSTTVSNSDPLEAGFRYRAIAPLALGPGNYVISGTTGPDQYLYDPAVFSTAPEVTYVTDRYVASSSLDFPVEGTSVNRGYFGPNFKFSTASVGVPEPSSALALGIGVLLCARLRRAGRNG
ncbi:hypothetical protein F183_A42720 [Bryobacterales bacterium F-183]|nr:hypothetical protein F183_A42720 [Bryobacterales bacterium F-183]